MNKFEVEGIERHCSAAHRSPLTGRLQRTGQSAHDERTHGTRLTKPDFGLGWMDVDIDGARIKRDKQRQERITPLRQQIAIGCPYRTDQKLIAHRAAVDEQVLLTRIRAMQHREAREP